MDDYDLTRQHLREIATQTMKIVDPDELEQRFRSAFESPPSWTDWDEHFVEIIENAPPGGLIAGDVGDDWHFAFCPANAEGFWVLLRPDMRGKGLLQPVSVEALTQLARAKHLIS